MTPRDARDARDEHRSHERTAAPLLVGAVVLAVLAAVYAVLGRVALDGFPFSGDEYSNVLQAEIFARGLLHTPAPAHAELLRVDHVVIDDWVRTKYPPGTAALLAIGVRAGAVWLVGPIEAAVALLAIGYVVRAHLGDRHARFALLVVGLAPLFAFQAATYYGHIPAMMWLALATAAVSRWRRAIGDPSPGASTPGRAAWANGILWGLPAGAALGCAFLTRPSDAVYFAPALLVFRAPALLVGVAAGAAPFAAALLAYQNAQFGSPFADGYHAYEPTFRALYGDTGQHAIAVSYLWDPKQLANHLDQLTSFVQDWTIPGTVLIAIAGAFATRERSPGATMRAFFIAVAAVPVAALLVTIGDPDDGPRPRYLTATLLSLAFFVGPGWDAAKGALAGLVGRRLAQAAAVAALVMGPVEVGGFLGRRIPDVWRREGLYTAVRAEGIDDGVVVVRADYPSRYARNGPFFDRPVLYLSPPAEMPIERIALLYPGRPLYEATEGAHWKIVRRM